MNALTMEAGLTMSSREISTLTGKQHKNVLVDIKSMLETLGLTSAEFSADLPDSYGRPQPCFNLPKRETLILVSGYSVPLRAKIIDRWQELEAQAQLFPPKVAPAVAPAALTEDRMLLDLAFVDKASRTLGLSEAAKLTMLRGIQTAYNLTPTLPDAAPSPAPSRAGRPMPRHKHSLPVAAEGLRMTLRQYWCSLDKDQKEDYATRCGTTKSYMANAITNGKVPETARAIALHRESGGVVPLEFLVPDADWSAIRGA